MRRSRTQRNAAGPFAKLDGFMHRRVGGNSIEHHDLVDAEPQNRPQLDLDLIGGAGNQCLQDGIECPLPSYDPTGQFRRQRSLDNGKPGFAEDAIQQIANPHTADAVFFEYPQSGIACGTDRERQKIIGLRKLRRWHTFSRRAAKA